MISERPLEGRRILIVEDSYPQAADTIEWLTQAGASIVGPAGNARRAEGLLREEFDMAVLDLNLGEGPDYAIAEALTDRGIPFVLTTGYDSHVIDPRFKRVPHLSKPISMHELMQALTDLPEANKSAASSTE